MSIHIWAYNMGSESAKLLADALDCWIIKHVKSRFRPGPKKRVINWGSTNIDIEKLDPNIVNHPLAVRLATNKLKTFNMFAANGVSCPDWTSDPKQVEKWLDEGHTVMARTIVDGSEGAGIEWCEKGKIPHAKLYVKYVKKKKEYRAHVVDGKVILIHEKKRKKDHEGDGDVRIRNTANGYVFCRLDHEPDKSISEQAIEAVKSLNLDFGACDIIWNDHYKKAYVLEVNTAPGIEGATVDAYTKAFKEFVK